MSKIKELIAGEVRLVTLPEIYLRLKQLLEREDYSLPEVAEIVAQDPAITTRLLRLVNSPYFGFAARIETVPRAISMLGSQQVHDLVLATSVVDRFQGMSSRVMDMAIYWRNSVRCAILARLLAEQCHVLDGERLFVAGLLRDIGHLIIYQTVPELAQQATEEAEDTAQPLFLVEQRLMGLDYAQVGGAMMHHWGLPRSLQESTEFHVRPLRATGFPLETGIVHIAWVLTEAALRNPGIEFWQPRVESIAWRLTGLSPEQCEQIQSTAESQLSEVVNLLIPAPMQSRR